LIAALGASAIAWGLLQLARSGAETLAAQAIGGLNSYVAPYFDTSSTRHAFSFLGWAHVRAVFNDLLLTAPVAWALLPTAWLLRRSRPAHPTTGFMSVAALGCLAINVLFNREIGPYRDWDTLAPYAFVYLAWMSLVVGQQAITQHRHIVWMLVVTGVFHVLPWTVLNATPSAAVRHIRLVLNEDGLWSPYARGVMYEEFAVQRRNRGDLHGSLRDYEAASRATPTDARYHQGLGEIWYRLGRPERALREWELALHWRPDYFPAHNNLAALLAFEGRDLERARHHAQVAVRLEPENADAWFTFADVHQRVGELDVARRAYQQALRLRPGWSKAQNKLDKLEEAARQQPDR
jgi:tetratricopeptide (TPR) repeat protein